MDEFDAIARARGGSAGSGGQGDAGVARDSLVSLIERTVRYTGRFFANYSSQIGFQVNQMLACLDGVEPPVVPTFVIGLTNKRSLIDPGKWLLE